MAGKLTKEEYEKALSAEYGFPVFLNQKEFERLSVSKPSPVAPKQAWQDPFEYMGEWRAKKDAETKAKKTDAAAGADRAKAAHASAYGTPAGDTWGTESAYPKAWGASMPAPHPNATGKSNAVAAPANIGKIASPSAPKDTDYASMTYVAPPVYGLPTSAGKPFVVEQYDYDAYDFGIPSTGDVLTAKAPVGTVYPQVAGNKALDPWANDAQMYAAAFGGKK